MAVDTLVGEGSGGVKHHRGTGHRRQHIAAGIGHHEVASCLVPRRSWIRIHRAGVGRCQRTATGIHSQHDRCVHHTGHGHVIDTPSAGRVTEAVTKEVRPGQTREDVDVREHEPYADGTTSGCIQIEQRLDPDTRTGLAQFTLGEGFAHSCGVRAGVVTQRGEHELREAATGGTVETQRVVRIKVVIFGGNAVCVVSDSHRAGGCRVVARSRAQSGR